MGGEPILSLHRVIIVLSFSILLVYMSFPSFAAEIDNDHGGGSSQSNDENLATQFLAPQNQARARVGDPPLVWDDKVAKYAEGWADERRGDCALEHSNGPYGENIFWGSGADWQPKDAVATWIGENQYYHYYSNSCDGNEQCGHYTQVVWKNSRRVGCASVICNNGDTFMTCNYDPPGNYIGEKPY